MVVYPKGFGNAIEFSDLERVFIEMAQIVFAYFGKDGERTVATERRDQSDDYWEYMARRHIFVNEDITVEVCHEVKLHDNSVTSELLYGIFMSVYIIGVEMLSMDSVLTQPCLYKLYYRCDPMYQAFATHYLTHFQAKMNE